MNSLALLAAAAGLRWSTANWGFPRTPTIFGTRLAEPGAAFATVCATVVFLFPAVNFGFLLTLRVARDACKRFLSQPILARMIPIVLPPVTALTVLLLAHDTKKPLAALEPYEQDEVLKAIAREIKQAALGATGRFVAQAKE